MYTKRFVDCHENFYRIILDGNLILIFTHFKYIYNTVFLRFILLAFEK